MKWIGIVFVEFIIIGQPVAVRIGIAGISFEFDLEQHYLPIKCGHCGRYFLLESGKFSQYCTRPIKGNEDKVCRDVRFREKYSNKIKSDPIWLIYSRAYKQHYARYLKKKMSQAEFWKWADYALELRQKALDGKLDLEEYKGLIRE